MLHLACTYCMYISRVHIAVLDGRDGRRVGSGYGGSSHVVGFCILRWETDGARGVGSGFDFLEQGF